MKTFFLNIPESIKKVGEKLNAKSSICDKAWEVYNEDDLKLVYIFNRDGSLMISTNGDVERASWQYLKANCSFILNTAEGSSMFIPTYLDDVLLILQKDGTDNYLLLLNADEKVIKRTLLAISSYLEQKNVEYEEAHIRKKRREQMKSARMEREEEEGYSWINDKRV